MTETELTEQRKTLRERAVGVVIPTYNNGGTIDDVVRRTLAQCDQVIVVDDGSTDETPVILSRLAREAGGRLTVVTLPENRGKGAALKAGFRQARHSGLAYAITLDGDGQHDPADIAAMLAANRTHPGALIVGSRQQKGQTGGSRFANRLSNFWFRVQTGRRLHDTQTGYRLYPLRKLRGLRLLTARYEAELALLVMAAWHGVELAETPVSVYYPPEAVRVSHFRPGRDFVRIALLNTLLTLLAVVYGLPLRLWRTLARLGRTLVSFLFFAFFAVVVFTPAAWVYVHAGRMTEQKRLNLHRLIHWAMRTVMMRIGIPGTTFRTQVADGVDFDRPRVIVSNHQSHLDLACQLVFSPRVVFLTNDWVWRNPFYGFLIRQAEYYPVSEGLDTLLPRLRSLVDRGYSIAVYPEGTRSKDCRIGRFHQGAFHIARELGLDLLPMYLYGPGRVLPKGRYTLRRGPLRVEVGAPFSRDVLDAIGDARRQAAWMRRHYESKYEEMANRIEQDV